MTKVNLLLQQVNKLMLLRSCSCSCSASAACHSLSLLSSAAPLPLPLAIHYFSRCSLPFPSCSEGGEMMMMGRGGVGGGGSMYPFTASQWQELELQALVFKYMVTGIPVPSDLVLCIRRSLFMDPQTLPFLPNPPPSIGWGGYQMADARKAVDPEPGRCRRTDGKKWRCSKEAYPDSKYCERHMHRGKSRSRKPVELSLATSSPSFPPPPPPLSLSTPQTHQFLFPCSSSSSSSSPRPHPTMGYEASTNYCLESLPHIPVDRYNYRSILGFKEGVNEYPFLSESCGGVREMPLQSYGNSHYRVSVSDREEQEKDKHYFLLGADLKSERGAKLERGAEAEPPPNARQFHCFLDEKPPKIENSWMGVNLDLKTQLSISIPMANHDTPVTAASQCCNDG